jgi:putative effector of murein hydrolase
MNHFYASLIEDDAARLIAAGCFVLTVALYFAAKQLYARFRRPWLTPLLAVS